MAKVLLIMPRLPARIGAPYIGQQYVAACLLERGHDVRCLDLAAPGPDRSDDDVVSLVRGWLPDVIGMTLFTVNALRAYALAENLRQQDALLVAGGPHATVRPREALDSGFDAVVTGDGEHALSAVADAIDAGARDSIRSVPGCALCAEEISPPRWIEDLDSLPFPHNSYACFDAQAYSPQGVAATGGMIAGRGCPCRCTFCSIGGAARPLRFRSASNVVSEMTALRTAHGIMHFSFWDDAFTANTSRVVDLCRAIAGKDALAGVTWSCMTPINMARPSLLAEMRNAGCVAINFGVESGDDRVLRTIEKGLRTADVLPVVKSAKAEGMTTILNFMFGFPGEGIEELERTLALMESLAPYADVFNNRGVLVPFPGTPVYERWHEQHGFTDWWLNPVMVPDEPDLGALEGTEAQEQLECDPTLELDFFRYSDPVREKIAECVRFKALRNQERIRRFTMNSAVE
jgi:anaerobic magnesium-protoporphyrin IX monomethyl ester cyclase